MELIFEFIFSIFGELLLQILFEGLVELGFHSLANALKRKPHPILAFIGCILWGAIAGLISLLIFPESFIDSQILHITNIIVTPIIIAFIMTFIGFIRTKKGQNIVSLDRFSFAYAFAFTMCLVRFMWAG